MTDFKELIFFLNQETIKENIDEFYLVPNSMKKKTNTKPSAMSIEKQQTGGNIYNS